MDNRIKKAYDYIKKNYSSKLLLSDLASGAGLSSFFFQRLFKEHMGQTPSECLNSIRLKRAIHLMEINPGMPMSQIADDCGFSSLSTFSRSFSKAFGAPPQAYKKRVHKIIPFEPIQKDFKPEIVYYPGATVFYNHICFYEDTLMNEFVLAREFCERNNIPCSKEMIGILTHNSFHGPKNSLNYYAGNPVGPGISEEYQDRLFQIPEGKYVCFTTDASYHNFFHLMMQFKTQWLDKHNYSIKEIFAFEEIESSNKQSDYQNIKRKIFIPVKRDNKN
jgi:AraC-like DNA-binding protein/predicted transcriptional regulator YdeE